MKPVIIVSRRLPRHLCSVLLAGLLAWGGTCPLRAQAAATGVITGRVYNPSTQEYVRNAEVRLEGTNQLVATESDGTFQITNVPAGRATLTVTYTGYDTVSESIVIEPGQTVTRSINLTSTLARAQEGELVKMGQFIVSSEREGNAKAIMDQRRNMNISTSVAADVYGDLNDGNVGEFLKFMPGLDIDYIQSEARGVRLGGMDSEYAGFAIDGVKLASADADPNRGGGMLRSVSMESVSISTVESIEISRTTSPDMDADSPAGTINMKTRRAFDRKGRRVNFNGAVTFNSEEFHFSRNYGPDDRRNYKFRPALALDYSDVFLNQRLGIVVSLSRANSYAEQYRVTHTYNRNATAADPRPIVLTAINFKDGPQFILKDTVTLSADFKATSRLVLSLSAIANISDRRTTNRELRFTAGSNNTNANTGRQNVLGSLTDFRTNGLSSNTSRTVGLGGGSTHKVTDTRTLAPRFEYKLGRLTVEGVSSYSRSKNTYRSLEQGWAQSTAVNTVVGDWQATRPSSNSAEWTITQLSGPDWFDAANFRNPRMSNDARTHITEIYSGGLSGTWVSPLQRFPTTLKLGGKWHEEARKLRNTSTLYNWSYLGPGGGSSGSWAGYTSGHLFDMGKTGALAVRNIGGRVGMVPFADRIAIRELFYAHPEYFNNTVSGDQYFNAHVANTRNLWQTITSGYAMADVRLSRKLQLRGGVRWEETETKSRECDPLPARDVLAAGFAVNAARRATTIPGIEYQYFSRPKVTRTATYDNLFPSLSAKYSFTRNLTAQFGFNKAIARPPVDSLSGTWTINDVNMTVTAPNPSLLPEYSKNYVGRLAYYFEPVGSFTVTLTQNDISNLRQTYEFTAEEFGYGDDPLLAGYEFISVRNTSGRRRFRGLELGYSQTLSFLPGLFRGTTVNAAYTRAYSNARRGGMAPHRASANVAYSYRRFTSRIGIVWIDDTPFGGSYGRYRRHEAKADLNVGWRLTSRYSLYAQGRNIFNGSNQNYDSPFIEGEAGALQRYESHGTAWVFGAKGTF